MTVFRFLSINLRSDLNALSLVQKPDHAVTASRDALASHSYFGCDWLAECIFLCQTISDNPCRIFDLPEGTGLCLHLTFGSRASVGLLADNRYQRAFCGAEDLDSPLFQVGAEGADHALTVLLPFVAAAIV
jgi:hypothetical protein